MIYLILDILFYSLTPFNTSFFLFYLTYKKDYFNIISLLIIIYLTHNLLYIPIFLFAFFFKKYHYFNICHKFFQLLIIYLLFFNIHINVNSFLILLILYFYYQSFFNLSNITSLKDIN